VRRALGDYTFERFIAMKKQEWDDYRIQVTLYEIEKFLPVV
jgi:glutamine synthetase